MQNMISNPDHFAVIAITRDQARVWRHGIGSEDLPEFVLPPLEVDHRHRRTSQNRHGHDSSHRFPEYFEEISEMVRGYDGILIMGHGSGNSSYMNLLKDYLDKKHPDVAGKILDLVSLDLTRMSEAEIAMHAREWFSKNYRKLATWHERQPFKYL